VNGRWFHDVRACRPSATTPSSLTRFPGESPEGVRLLDTPWGTMQTHARDRSDGPEANGRIRPTRTGVDAQLASHELRGPSHPRDPYRRLNNHAAADVSQTLVLVVVSIVVAIGLDPAVRWLVRMGMRRGLAVATIFLAAGLFVFLFVLLVGPPLVRQITGLADHIPGYAADLAKRDDWIGRYFREHDVATSVKEFVADIPSKVAASFGTIVGVAGRIGSGIFQLATVAILSIYFSLSSRACARPWRC
jgi:hypothetical protein